MHTSMGQGYSSVPLVKTTNLVCLFGSIFSLVQSQVSGFKIVSLGMVATFIVKLKGQVISQQLFLKSFLWLPPWGYKETQREAWCEWRPRASAFRQKLGTLESCHLAQRNLEMSFSVASLIGVNFGIIFCSCWESLWQSTPNHKTLSKNAHSMEVIFWVILW